MRCWWCLPAIAAILPLHAFKLPARIYPADSRLTLRFTPESAWAKKVFSAPNLRVYYMRDDRRFMDTAASSGCKNGSG